MHSYLIKTLVLREKTNKLKFHPKGNLSTNKKLEISCYVSNGPLPNSFYYAKLISKSPEYPHAP